MNMEVYLGIRLYDNDQKEYKVSLEFGMVTIGNDHTGYK